MHPYFGHSILKPALVVPCVSAMGWSVPECPRDSNEEHSRGRGLGAHKDTSIRRDSSCDHVVVKHTCLDACTCLWFSVAVFGGAGWTFHCIQEGDHFKNKGGKSFFGLLLSVSWVPMELERSSPRHTLDTDTNTKVTCFTGLTLLLPFSFIFPLSVLSLYSRLVSSFYSRSLFSLYSLSLFSLCSLYSLSIPSIPSILSLFPLFSLYSLYSLSIPSHYSLYILSLYSLSILSLFPLSHPPAVPLTFDPHLPDARAFDLLCIEC